MDLMNRPWLSQFLNRYNRNPVVIVGAIRNRTSEHIDSGMFVKNIERELINSGKVQFVAASDERKQLIEERYHQQSHASEDTAASLAQETGADFMLIGTMTSSVDSSGGKSTRFYQVDMELIRIENNEKVWMGQKQIKKEVGRPSTSW
jgi:penicillin-binding protein activator